MTHTVVVRAQSEYSAKMQECLISMDSASDPGFDFEMYYEDIRMAINSSEYIFDTEPLSKAVIV